MYYRTTPHFLHGGPICPNENDAKNRMITNEPIFLYPSLPVPTVTVPTLTTSMQDTKLSQVEVVRIIKCLGHGCSVEATADICEVDTRTVQRLLEKSGKRAADFHCLQLENLDEPLEAVQMDELHGKTVKRKDKNEVVKVPKKLRRRLSKKRAKHGFIRLWL